jgi:hypothetical protein
MRILALLALALPALAQPLTERGYIACDDHNNRPDTRDCEVLIGLLGDEPVSASDEGYCFGGCCVSWSRSCTARKSALRWNVQVIKDGCDSGSSGRLWDVDECFGTVCLSNRTDGCSEPL